VTAGLEPAKVFNFSSADRVGLILRYFAIDALCNEAESIRQQEAIQLVTDK
jgi:hypothetical protein